MTPRWIADLVKYKWYEWKYKQQNVGEYDLRRWIQVKITK